jgi:hypothetical protein
MNGQAEPCGFAPSQTFIDQDEIRLEQEGKLDRRAFTGVEQFADVLVDVLPKWLDREPWRIRSDPFANFGWGGSSSSLSTASGIVTAPATRGIRSAR